MTEKMTNVDNFWLCMDEPTNLMEITGFMEFERPLNFERLKATVEHRLLCFDRFRQRVVRTMSGVGVPDWEFDEHFDIRSHVHRLALPSPGSKTDLQEMISDLMAIPLDQTKPLWQFYLIENYGTGSVLFAKLHHCIADGIALIQVLLSMTDTTSDAPWPESKTKGRKADKSLLSFLPVKSVFRGIKGAVDTTRLVRKKVAEEVMGAVSNPFHAIDLARTGAGLAVDAASVITRLTLLPPHPANSFRGELGVRKCVAWTEPITLKHVKTVGQAVEATLNDVLIATVTGALRRYLKKRNDNVNELELQVTVPVNIRKPGTEFDLGNKFSLVWLALPVHIEDPVLRLREVKRRMDKLKRSPDAFVVFSVLNALGMSPVKVAKRAAHIFANKSTGVLTNVPGPRQPLYFSGEKIRNTMFWVPKIGRVGLGISIFSYAGTVTVGIVSDEKRVPDPASILEGFETDFNALLNLVISGKIYDGPLVINDRYLEAVQKTEEDEKETVPAEPDLKPDLKPGQCKALARNGRQCKNHARPGSEYCGVHQNYEVKAPDEMPQAVEA